MPTKIIAEIGINHNGDINVAKRLIDIAAAAGCDYVKFQKRNPEKSTPETMRHTKRETPWGVMDYIDYKNKLEFGNNEYDQIAAHCVQAGIKWTASPWDIESYLFLLDYRPDFIKIPSAMLTDKLFLTLLKDHETRVVLSTGMSDMPMIEDAVSMVGEKNIAAILHCTSTYPAKTEELNLRCIETLRKRFPRTEIGFSNHHPGVVYMAAAVALGAKWIEFHVTLDRAMWGTDQSASIEPEGIFKLVKYVRGIEAAMGDGEKRIYDSERPIIKKLRRAA